MSLPECHVFIATSLDGYIADAEGGVEWLTSLPVIEGEDFGYAAFMQGIDGLLMGAGSFRSVLAFDAWPYDRPVRVLSNQMDEAEIPEPLRDRVRFLRGNPGEALAALAAEGWTRVYLDGGQMITSFLRAGLVQRLVVTRVPVLLGAGRPLYGATGAHRLQHLETRSWANGFVQSTYAVDRG